MIALGIYQQGVGHGILLTEKDLTDSGIDGFAA